MKPILSSHWAYLSGALAVTYALAACVPAPDSTPSPEPTPTYVPVTVTPAPTPPPVASQAPANWIDLPRTPGTWTYRGPSDGQASYLSPSGDILVQIECTADGDIFLSAPSTDYAAQAITIRTESLTRTLSADAGEGSIRTTLGPQDRLLDAMALTRGRFALEVPGSAPLYLPAWAEVSRVIEDCR